jgi:hypothetical protein
MTTTPAATTEEALASLQLQINNQNETIAGLQKNILVLDGNLQKIYAAFNNQVVNKPNNLPPLPGGGFM